MEARSQSFAVVLASSLLLSIACGQQAGSSPPQSAIFTPAHRTLGAAVRDFFGVHPPARQPIPFPHSVHIAKGLTCVEYCHESVTKSAVAGLPSVKTCMICHDAIATDRPLIQQISDMHRRGVDLSWQRVYGYTAEAHVRFNHVAHIRANIDCATCHGRVDQQTVAVRSVKLDMGFCVRCHRSRQASNDCLTCHF